MGALSHAARYEDDAGRETLTGMESPDSRAGSYGREPYHSKDDSNSGAAVEPSLSPGIMDAETERRIQKARERTPRYLFRCWNNADFPSGGHEDLNTTAAITPLAFSSYGSGGDPSIYHLSRKALGDMVASHLHGENVATQFSSWAASLQTAFTFDSGLPGNCYVSIIDTKRLPNNVILHVPSMDFLLGESSACDHEYLAHGVISGPAHKAVPLWAFIEVAPHFYGTGIPRSHFPGPAPIGSYSSIYWEEVADARWVGDMYGGSFVVPVTIAILCQQQRHGKFWRGSAPDLDIVALALADCEIPAELCQDATVLTDIVYTFGFGDVEQMIRLLRALVRHRYDQGASGQRSKSE
ncbi:hypothetical protein LTR85_005113 [Meristemomyces frigidus]|nr:hypothetical protein LTR85_005113 [Meristemomyces frigidus]